MPLQEQFVPGQQGLSRPRGNTVATRLAQEATAIVNRSTPGGGGGGFQPNDPRASGQAAFQQATGGIDTLAGSNETGPGLDALAGAGPGPQAFLAALGQAEQSAPVNLGGGSGGGGGTGLSSALSQIALQYGGLRDEASGNRDFALGEISAALADHQSQIDRIAEDYMAQSGEVNENIARRYAEAVDRTTADADPLIADLRAQGIDPSQFATTLVEANQATRTQGALQSALGERLAQIQSDGLNDSRRTASLIDQGATTEVERQYQVQVDRIAEAQLAAEIQARAQAAAAARRASAAVSGRSGGGGQDDADAQLVAQLFQAQGLPLDAAQIRALDEFSLVDNFLGFAEPVEPGFDEGVASLYASNPDLLNNALSEGRATPEIAEAVARSNAGAAEVTRRVGNAANVLVRRIAR